MAKHKILNFPFALLTVYAALLIPVYCKLLLVDLESDGDGTQLGSPELSHEGRNTMQGELRQCKGGLLTFSFTIYGLDGPNQRQLQIP